MVRENVRLAPDDGDAIGLRAQRPLEPQVLLVGAAELAQEVPQRRLAVPEETLQFEMGLGLEDKTRGQWPYRSASSIRWPPRS